MTNIEFNSVMKALKVEFNENDEVKYYFIGDTVIYYDEKYAKIYNLPIDVNLILHDNYSNLTMELDRIHDFRECFINTKEGLVITCFELQKYYNNHLLEYYGLDNLETVIEEVNSEILKSIIPDVSNYKWMKYDKVNNETFIRNIKDSKKDLFRKELKDCLDRFDKVVNPYMIKNIKMDKLSNYINNVNISGDIWTEEDKDLGYKRNYCGRLSITDKKNGNSVCYERHIDGFSFSVDYVTDDNKTVFVKHSYHGNSESKFDRGEVITFRYFKNGMMNEINYNVTKDKTFNYTSEGVITGRLSLKEKFNLYWELLDAIDKAEDITVNNMVRKEPKKVFEIK